MTDLLGFTAYLVLPLIGWGVTRLPAVRVMPLYGKVAVAFAFGALLIPVFLATLSFAGIQWRSWILFTAAAIIVAANFFLPRKRSGGPEKERTPAPVASWLFLLFVVYAATSARMTSGDTSFFWGPKGVAFFRAGGIDVEFLRNPDYYLMHSDYPPLLPLLFVWSNTFSRQFGWFAAIFASVVFLGCTVAIVHSLSRDRDRTLLFTAIASYAYVVQFVGGGADPPLLLYEVMALASLTVLPPSPSQSALAAIGLAGAAWSKVEGAAFVCAVLIALLVTRFNLRRIAIIIGPAVALLAAWIAFVLHHRLLDAYGGLPTLHMNAIPMTVSRLIAHARSDVLWVPWVVPLVAIAIGPNRRRAILPVMVSALLFAALVYAYIHEADPTFWIDSSANRSLLPPLFALLVAAVAAGPDQRAVAVAAS